MWKLQGAEPHFRGGKTFDTLPDGVEVRLDIRTGRIVESGGDLIFVLNYRFQSSKVSSDGRYNWSAIITVVDGGLVEANQRIENMMEAPESGYNSSFVWKMPAGYPNVPHEPTKNFYAKFRGAQFARLLIHLEGPNGRTQATWWVNPSGSRNLEYDEKLRIVPK